MKALTLAYAAQSMHASLLNADGFFTGVKVDSRQISKGDLFFALKGLKVDGHDYIKEAEAKGASGVVVSRPVHTHLPMLLVEDTLQALGALAKTYRNTFQIPIMAITGSCGKTTVKEMLNSILSLQASTLFTQGNLNTEVGVPFTLLDLLPEHEFAIIEMGARKKGDIAYLMSLVNPTVSLITNAGNAHLEIFGSEKAIAETKGEIFEQLSLQGTAVINQDDKYASYWKSLLKQQQNCLTFGTTNADIMATNVKVEATFSEWDLITDVGAARLRLSVPGEHMIQNALAAAAGARALGVSLEIIQKGLTNFSPMVGRLQYKKGLAGAMIIDDSYNANPVSMRAALEVLAKYPSPKILVMGDMFELGKDGQRFHQQIGQKAKQLGIDKLVGVGELTAVAIEAFGKEGKHYVDKGSLINALKEHITKETTILVKGSRGMRMDEIVLELTS